MIDKLAVDKTKVDEIKKHLKNNQSFYRYQHSLNVADEAIKLGERYSHNLEDCYLGGLLHDSGKVETTEQLKILLKKIDYDLGNMDIEEAFRDANEHAIIGSVVANKMFNIQNDDIINAVRYHTTGRDNMSLLEKIVYIADYIEVGRNFPGVEQARELAYRDIDEAILYALNRTIVDVVEKNKILYVDTVKARNYIIKKGSGGQI